jgi:SAM-dependent methyltransferase
MKLNLGCGRFLKVDAVNLDRHPYPGVDIVHDLDAFPYPFADDAFDRIDGDHVLEHLASPFGVMRELHRILKPGGILVLRVPHFTRGFSHPEHRRGFDATFPYYFVPTFPGEYAGVAFDCLSVRMRWFAQPYLKRSVLPAPLFHVGRAVGGIVNGAANLWPLFASRVWAYWVGGFEEIEFVFRKPA